MFGCLDCGVRVDLREAGQQELYMVSLDIWDGIFTAEEMEAHTASDGIVDEPDLCIGCLEKRLGRRLTPSDFPDWVGNDNSDGRATPRLVDRRGY